MHHSALHEARRKQPFVPFRIMLNSGKWYDIRSSESIIVTNYETAVDEHDEVRTFANSQILEVERVSPELS